MRESPLDLCMCLVAPELMPRLLEWLKTGMLYFYVVLLYALAPLRKGCAVSQGRRDGSFSRGCAACSETMQGIDIVLLYAGKHSAVDCCIPQPPPERVTFENSSLSYTVCVRCHQVVRYLFAICCYNSGESGSAMPVYARLYVRCRQSISVSHMQGWEAVGTCKMPRQHWPFLLRG